MIRPRFAAHASCLIRKTLSNIHCNILASLSCGNGDAGRPGRVYSEYTEAESAFSINSTRFRVQGDTQQKRGVARDRLAQEARRARHWLGIYSRIKEAHTASFTRNDFILPLLRCVAQTSMYCVKCLRRAVMRPCRRRYLFWGDAGGTFRRRTAACMLGQRLPSALHSVLPLSPHIDKKCT